MFKDFPSLHPLVVHFPIVLILLAAAFQIMVVWKPHWRQICWATLFIMAAAFFSALAASTIFHAMPSADAPKAAMQIFEEHEKYAQLTLWMSGITLLLKSIGIFFKINRRLYELIVLLAAIIAAIFLSIAGHHGAKLTHVAGVGPMGKYLMKDHGAGHDEKDMEGMDMNGDSTTHLNDTHMNDSMPGMKNMPGMDTMKGMNNMKGMEDMKDMKNMPGMDKMKDMKNMPGMDKMKDMKDMPGMDTMKNMKDMKDMPGMDSTMKMEDMKNMNMPMKNPMDTFRFPDNNPARKKAKKPVKQ
ncbi:DUF2231 domain-containing protein [Flavihumibacter sp. ZG627]|uniref:DUF2231 domain-containing protein n=1 Tax=Flavihumibacter sp. ZG627 TaxID=1463156 RepID=UPI0012E00A86|nr:DUF2231 domain-containing protein [Flavihumibacter sp. ZG627]